MDFTDKDKVYETGFNEETILKLLSTGSVDRVLRTIEIGSM